MFDIDYKYICNFSISSRARGFYIKSKMSEQNYSYIGYGFTRWVFLSPDKSNVIKFPITMFGLSANETEEKIYRYSIKNKTTMQFAKCRLIENCILEMESVECFGMKEGMKDLREIGIEYPDWAKNIDCFQVGFNKDMMIVAYDYGNLDMSDIS